MDEPLSERLDKAIAQDINRNISGIDDYRHGQVIIRDTEHLPPVANQANQLMMQLVYKCGHDEAETEHMERFALSESDEIIGCPI